MKVLAALTALILSAGCAGPRAPAAPSDTGQLWEANATVLEDASHGPMLCLGSILQSLPPQCGDVDIVNWDWGRVEGEERMGRTIYGEYRVTGTLEDRRFTVASYLGPAAGGEDPYDESELNPPCPEPAGGWKAVDASRTTDRDLGRTTAFAESRSDSAGMWIKQPPKEFLTPEERASIIVTAAFTGDLDRHEAELRDYWGGPLCVIELPRSLKELDRIQEEVGGRVGKDLGLVILSTEQDWVGNQVVADVAIAEPDAQAALDARYGVGTVRLVGALTPVP